MKFIERYIQFLTELEQIDQNHEGLTDTDVRERMGEVINYYFIWGNPITPDIPRYFFMPTPNGDKALFKATYTFIIDALVCANAERIDTPAARHAALGDPAAITPQGNAYWLFLGYSENVLAPLKPDSGEDYGYFEYE
jgi:hypothetical protein